MKKLIALTLSALLLLTLFAGCKKNENTDTPAETVDVRIMALKGPTGIGMAKMMDEKPEGYTFSIAGKPDEVVAAVSGGKVDIAAVPTNLAATLYKRTEKGIKMIAINTLGSLYILENGNTINSFADLRGKTIYATGKGANPEYVLNYLLEKNGLTVGEDVFVDYTYGTEHAQLATALAAGECAVGMLPEPNVSSAMAQNKDLRIALNLNEEWDKVADESSRLTMGCVIVRNEFLEEHPEAVKAFIEKLDSSIKFATENPKDAGTLCETYGIVPKAALATKAIPNCNMMLIKGADMKPAIEGYFTVLHAANPKSVGGAVPDEGFYYIP